MTLENTNMYVMKEIYRIVFKKKVSTILYSMLMVKNFYRPLKY
jgi:hypothetical protein